MKRAKNYNVFHMPTLHKRTGNVAVGLSIKTGAPNDNFRKISVRKTI